MIIKVYFLLCMILPCVIYQIIMISHQKDHKNRILHMIWVYIFLFYIYLVLNVTGIGTIWDIGCYGTVIRFEEINFKLLQSHDMLPYILNILMFMPLGFLLPFIWQKMRSFPKVLLTGCFFSLIIEMCQLLNFRCSDVDDILMNTLGAIVGYLLWKIGSLCFDSFYQGMNALSKWEPVVYLLLSILGVFLLYNSRLVYF